VLAAAAAASVAAGALLGGGVAQASRPPFEPDPDAYGAIVFLNAAGAIVTKGSTRSPGIAAYAVGTVAAPPAKDGGRAASSYSEVRLELAAPRPGVKSLFWPSFPLSSFSAYPIAKGRASLVGLTDRTGQYLPVQRVHASDLSLNAAIATFAPLPQSSPEFDVYQVRLEQRAPVTSSGRGFEWAVDNDYESVDIVANTTARAETLPSTDIYAGTKIAPFSWVLRYPHSRATSTRTSLEVTVPPSVGLTTRGLRTVVQLEATVRSAVPGTVTFYRLGSPIATRSVHLSGTTGMATLLVPQSGTASVSYQASFTPRPNYLVAPSRSAAVPVNLVRPIVATRTSATAPESVDAHTTATFRASVVAANGRRPAGTVRFVARPAGATHGAEHVLGSARANPPGSGQYAITVRPAERGSYTLTATFIPASRDYAGSSSTTAAFLLGVHVSAPTGGVNNDIPPGTLTISTPYGGSGVGATFDLGVLSLSDDGAMFTTAARFPNPGDGYVTVTSNRSGDPTWTASVTATNLSSGGTDPTYINAENLGFTDLTAVPISGGELTAADLTFTDIPADPGVSATDDSGGGLAGGPHPFVTTAPNGGNGSINIYGTLTLNAPPSTPAGVYTGTITLTVM
jgi:hypothetical protein